ncbi:helix-turn-helix domain-containing protein [Clostridium intestinale]|uniref:helix-turn-helix domain-containing protein n=1 Tax=Clostridium intestinale TaxID=36845 RepID=UPI002DD69240|nr:helix-turn-helix domain-containing protein [Clostridium intestinale]WRY50719.1 helix-turn-helix domain-containing protein [Clostridium intestinale]
MNEIKTTLTVEDIGRILNIGRNKAYSLVKEEGFPKIRIGKQFRIPYDAFNHWIENKVSNNS